MFLPVSTVYSPEQYFASKDGSSMLFGASTDLAPLTQTTQTRIALLYNTPTSTNDLYVARTQLTQNVDGDWVRYRLIPSTTTAFNLPTGATPATSINRGSGKLAAQGKLYNLVSGAISIPNAILIPEVAIQVMARVPYYVLENGSIVLGKGFGLVWAFTPPSGMTLKANSVGVENVWWEKP